MIRTILAFAALSLAAGVPSALNARLDVDAHALNEKYMALERKYAALQEQHSNLTLRNEQAGFAYNEPMADLAWTTEGDIIDLSSASLGKGIKQIKYGGQLINGSVVNAMSLKNSMAYQKACKFDIYARKKGGGFSPITVEIEPTFKDARWLPSSFRREASSQYSKGSYVWPTRTGSFLYGYKFGIDMSLDYEVLFKFSVMEAVELTEGFEFVLWTNGVTSVRLTPGFQMSFDAKGTFSVTMRGVMHYKNPDIGNQYAAIVSDHIRGKTSYSLDATATVTVGPYLQLSVTAFSEAMEAAMIAKLQTAITVSWGTSGYKFECEPYFQVDAEASLDMPNLWPSDIPDFCNSPGTTDEPGKGWSASATIQIYKKTLAKCCIGSACTATDTPCI